MKLEDIKKLSRKEFAERYPFVQVRDWDRETLKTFKATYGENGEPQLYFYTDSNSGWNNLLLIWAENVRKVLETMPKDSWDSFYIVDLKQKYGLLDLTLNGYLEEPYDKINEYCSMLRHLSEFFCPVCDNFGIAGKKNLVSYKSRGSWIEYYCRKCAKKITYQNIKDYGIKKDYFLKWLHSNPHFNMYKDIFNQEWERNVGSWKYSITTWDSDGKHRKEIDCREFFKDIV